MHAVAHALKDRLALAENVLRSEVGKGDTLDVTLSDKVGAFVPLPQRVDERLPETHPDCETL